MQKLRYWNVAVPKPIKNLFTYSYPDDTSLKGYRVLVPFGNNNKSLQGIVVNEITQINPSQKIKPITEILDTTPCFSDNMLNFISWMSDYYLCPIGETFRVAIPTGIGPKTLIKTFINRDTTLKQIKEIYEKNEKKYNSLPFTDTDFNFIDYLNRYEKNEDRLKLLSFLHSETESFSIDYLEKYLGINNIQYHINYLLDRNLIVLQQTNIRLQEKVLKAVKLSDKLTNNDDYLKETLDILDKKAKKQSDIIVLALLEHRKTGHPTFISNINKIIASPNSAIASLLKKELIEVVDVEIDRNKQNNSGTLATKNEYQLTLTDEQQHCVTEINNEISQHKFSPFLLHGVTGSGKTLIYIHTIKYALSLQKSVIILVPEISLTPQLVDRFNIVFPDQLSVIHSRLSDGERYDAWRSALYGKSQIILGARSALFAPLNNVGLIIVDEEHENSYKQDERIPYYQARDSAIMRAKIENCTIILGSATPSVESYYNAINQKYRLLEINNRADNATMPNITMVDMVNARRQGQSIDSFSRLMIDKIKEKINNKEGIILYQNKRGFASYLECIDCENIPQCRHCSVSLTYHQNTNELRCHYCGYTIKSITTCEVCGAKQLKKVGAGTQRIEQQLENILAEEDIKCTIARLDLDAVKKKGSHREILQRFNDGQVDILLGTQMVAKGLDFPNVTLVGVINADIQLMLPDFRAAERTFQLLSQVSGRAGRSSNKKGEVVIQTSQGHHYAIQSILHNDYKSIIAEELKHRSNAMFPPFVRYCLIEFSSKNEELANQKASEFHKILARIINSKNAIKQSIICYNPQSAVIHKLNDKYRIHISLKGLKNSDPQSTIMRKVISDAENEYLKHFANANVKMKIDIDSYIGY
ncbi:MAG: primosomal protein N' [Bacteroidetes bacterium]|nr:primosomal protein N' [Bacteroidota bacterium]